MSLNNIKNNKKNDGFTIVELLIVIVVIGILAAITIVAYNGVQKRANASAAQAAQNTLQKKAEAFNSVSSKYPTSTADFNSVPESTLTGSGLSLTAASAAPTAAAGKTVLKYEVCGTTGARITIWDYNANAVAAPVLMGDATVGSVCATVS
jgi:prepilin-type N-terminal cleavage/methylation domain-containing protein